MSYESYQSMINSRLVKFNLQSKTAPITLDDIFLLEVPILVIDPSLDRCIEILSQESNNIPNRSRFLLPDIGTYLSSDHVTTIKNEGYSQFISGGYIEKIDNQLVFRIYSDEGRPSDDAINPYTNSVYNNNDIIYSNDPAKDLSIGWIKSDGIWIDLYNVSKSGFVQRVPRLDENVPPEENQIGKLYYAEEGLFADSVKKNDPAIYLALNENDSNVWKKMSINDTDIQRYEYSIRNLFDDKLEESRLLVRDNLNDVSREFTKLSDSLIAQNEELDTAIEENLNSYKDATNSELNSRYNILKDSVDTNIIDWNNSVDKFLTEAAQAEESRQESIRQVNEWIANPDLIRGPKGLSAFEVWKINDGTPDSSLDDYYEYITGPQGPVGEGIHLKGSFDTESELPESAEVGDSYVIGEKLYIWNGSEYKSVQSVGPKGEQGIPGPRGPKGDPFRIMGTLNDKSELPSVETSKISEGYIIGKLLYQFDGLQWNSVGTIRGNDGIRGEKGAPGKNGLSPYEEWKLKTNNPTASYGEYLNSIKGDGLDIKGKLSNIEELNSIQDAQIGDIYLVENLMYVKLSEGWDLFNLSELDWIVRNIDNYSEDIGKILFNYTSDKTRNTTNENYFSKLYTKYSQLFDFLDSRADIVREVEDQISSVNTELGSQISSVSTELGNQIESLSSILGSHGHPISDIEGLQSILDHLDIDSKVDKVEGKGLSTNDFSNTYKDKLNSLNQVSEGDSIYDVKIIVEGGEAYLVSNEKGKTIVNDFYRINVNDEKVRFRIKSTSKGVILFYSMEDENLRYAIHVYPEERDYEIDFGKFVSGEMIFTTVTMPEDKVSVIREEGL